MTSDEREMEEGLRKKHRESVAQLGRQMVSFREQMERRIERTLLDFVTPAEKEHVLEGLYAVAEEEARDMRKRFAAAALLTDDPFIYQDALADLYRAKERLDVIRDRIDQLSAGEPSRGRTVE